MPGEGTPWGGVCRGRVEEVAMEAAEGRGEDRGETGRGGAKERGSSRWLPLSDTPVLRF